MLAKFLFRVFMDRDRAEVHKHAKIERDQYPATFTEQAWSKKDILYELTNTEKKKIVLVYLRALKGKPRNCFVFVVFILRALTLFWFSSIIYRFRQA